MRAVAKTLQNQFERGFSYSNVTRMRQFYLAYPQCSLAIPDGKARRRRAFCLPSRKARHCRTFSLTNQHGSQVE